VSTPDVKDYAALLREVARTVGFQGGAALADAAGLGREARRRTKGHWRHGAGDTVGPLGVRGSASA
jgi:hypothetical protein